MKRQAYQHPELRDANDNIIQAGTYGKTSPLVNSTNDGVLDYINNNLEALYDAQTAEVTRADGKYLPLSGGTMTGNIQWGVGSNGTHFGIQPNATGCDFGWWWDEHSGAGLGLRNVSHGNPGQFNLWATDGTTVKALVGNPNGTLLWDSKEVERVNASGTNYIRYENGLQICWGVSPDFNATGEKTVTFPAAFTSCRLAISRDWAVNWNENYYVKDKTNTSFKIVVIGTASTNNHSYSYVAVGRWK